MKNMTERTYKCGDITDQINDIILNFLWIKDTRHLNIKLKIWYLIGYY